MTTKDLCCNPFQWFRCLAKIRLWMPCRNKQSYSHWQTAFVQCRSVGNHNKYRIFLQNLWIQNINKHKQKTKTRNGHCQNNNCLRAPQFFQADVCHLSGNLLTSLISNKQLVTLDNLQFWNLVLLTILQYPMYLKSDCLTKTIKYNPWLHGWKTKANKKQFELSDDVHKTKL